MQKGRWKVAGLPMVELKRSEMMVELKWRSEIERWRSSW